MLDKALQFIATQPRVRLENWPTPLLPMDGLRRAFTPEPGCPRLWVKREDMTSYGAGGNKIRKLEFSLAKAEEAGADTLLTTGGVQSNLIVQTAAVAARLGMGCEVFVSRTNPPVSEDEGETGNILLCLLHGARVHIMGPKENYRHAIADRIEELEADGKRPFVVEAGATGPYSSFGPILCLKEMLDQAACRGFTPDGIAVPTGSSGTTAGFLIGLTLLAHSGGPRIPLYAFDTIGKDAAIPARERIMTTVAGCWELLGLPGECGDELLHLTSEFAEPGHFRPGANTIEAIRLVGSKEGMILDPSYTGKCMAGLIALIRKKAFAPSANIIYFHSGGMPALFAMRRML